MKLLTNLLAVNFYLIDQQNIQIEKVTGIYGQNGSGKSSVMDALQIALMGGNANHVSLNAQADDKSVKRSPRTIRDYCLGRWGVGEDEYVREHALTYLTLIFKDTETREPLSLGVCIAAQHNKDGHEVLGRYVVPGVELSMSDHLERIDEQDQPRDWTAFRLQLEERGGVAGVETVYSDSDRFIKAYLLQLRSSAGPASIDAFRKSLRFGLRMRFDQHVDEIVRTQVLEARPVDIRRFKEVVNSFAELRNVVARLKAKVESAEGVKQHYDKAVKDMRRAATWRALEADARAELALEAHDHALKALQAAGDRLEVIKAEIDGLTAAKAHAESEAARVKHLVEGHEAHTKLGTAKHQLEEKRVELAKAQEEFRKTVMLAVRLLGSAVSAGYAPQSATAVRNRLDAWLRAEPADSLRDEAKELLGEAISLLGVALAQGTAAIGQLERQRQDLEKELEHQQVNFARAKSGRPPLDDNVLRLQHALADAGIASTPVCDLVRVKDVEWQPAIEAYLGPSREALLISDVKREKDAFQVYRGLNRVYGAKIALESHHRNPVAPTKGSVAELLVGDYTAAVAYLRAQFGSTMRADDAEAISHARAMTKDAMLVASGALERLRPPAYLMLGGRDSGAQTAQFQQRIAEIQREIAVLDSRHAEASGLANQLAWFGNSKEALDSFLSHFDNFRGAHASVGEMKRMLEDFDDGSYGVLLEQASRLQEEAVAFNNQLLEKMSQQGSAAKDVTQMEERAATAGVTAEEARASARTLRADPYFDSETAPKSWDDLFRECSGDNAAMAGSAGRRYVNAKGSGEAAIREGEKALIEFVANFKEHLPQEVRDTTDAESWRKRGTWVDEMLARLRGTDLPRYEADVERAYQTAQTTFRNDVALKIHENIERMRDQISALNAVLRTCPPFSNGERYSFDAQLRPEFKTLYKFIQDVGTYGFESDLLGDAAQVPEEFRALIEQATEVGAGAAKSPLHDYREFFAFDIEIWREDPATRTLKKVANLSKRLGPSSGGEHRSPLYVIAGAALASAYRIASGATGGIRLIMLDEAFDKMDEPNTLATMRYLEDLGLQVLMAGPGKDIGVLNAFLHRYYEVARDPDNQALSFSGHSLTEEARRLSRADLVEFHPELLESEIAALSATVPTKRAAVTA